MENNFEIIIVGAGAAGLMAAMQLTAMGKKVLVLEARNRIGGRIHTIQSRGLFLEAGAEFIHGDLPLTLDLLKQGKIKYYKTKGTMRRSKKGKWIDDEFIENWDGLLDQMGKLKTDLPFADFLQKYFVGDQNKELRYSATRYAEGFDLADINKAGTKELFKEWNNEDHDQYRIKKGYGELMDYLYKKCMHAGCVILTGKTVTKIKWGKNEVKIFTQHEEIYTAKKVLTTIPVSLLQHEESEGSIQFDPAINDTVQAFQQIGFGSAIKFLLHFKKEFWQNEKKNISMFLSDQQIPVWWTQLPEKNKVLTGWLGGPGAEKLSAGTDDEILQSALKSLSVVFDIGVKDLSKQLISVHIFKWQKEKFSNGAYAYPLVKSKDAIKKLKKPIKETLFFAGEALYTGNAPGTVEAALVSGKEIASKILNSLKK
jgi:monoamine oxidase